MPDQITTAFVQEFKAAVDLLLQQEGSRFRGAVINDSFVGKAASAVEQFGPVAAVKRTKRHSDTPILDVPQAKRWIFPNDYEWGSLIDSQDRLRMIVDPTSPYARNGANAMARAQDDEVIGAFFADAKVGENGDEIEQFDASKFRIGVGVGGSNSSLNVAKMQKALQLLMHAFRGEVTEPIHIAVSSYEHDALLKEIQVTSSDFNGGQAVLRDGRIRRFVGMDFIISERLQETNGQRRIPVWVPTGMELGVWEDVVARVDPRPDKSYATQIYLSQTIGATRLQQGKVIEIRADDQIA